MDDQFQRAKALQGQVARTTVPKEVVTLHSAQESTPQQLVMEDGQVYSGRRLYENTYFILIMDEKENLRTISKRRIEQLNRPHKSLMPSFRKFLNSAEVEDLATYILSLRKGPAK